MLKRSVISSVIVLLFYVNSGASNCPLSMLQNANNSPRGQLRLSGRIVEGELVDDGSDHVKVSMKIIFDVKNVGSGNALILKLEPVIIDSMILATPSDANQNRYLFRFLTLPSFAGNSVREELQKRLNKPSPPPEEILVLAPNETWTFEVTNWFYIGKTTNRDPDSKPWTVIRQASPVSLEMTFQVWSSDIEQFVDFEKQKFSKRLKRRWQKFGDLQLEHLTSELIPLDFSSFAVRKVQN